MYNSEMKAHSTPSSVTTVLPDEAVQRLLHNIDGFSRLMTERIAQELALPRELSTFRAIRMTRRACSDALRTLIGSLQTPGGVDKNELARLATIGSATAQQGIPLEVLLGAYRLAAKVVWDVVIGSTYANTPLPPDALISITRHVLEYLDDISSAVGGAYLLTRESLLRQHDREREHILQRLLAGDAGEDLLREALRLDLTIEPPYRVIVIEVVHPEDAHHVDTTARSLKALFHHESQTLLSLLVPDRIPDDVLSNELEHLLHTVPLRCCIGPDNCAIEDIPQALARTRHALGIARHLAPDSRVITEAAFSLFASMLTDTDVTEQYVRAYLGPLLSLPEGKKEMYFATLSAYLEQGSIAPAAEALGIHRHSFTYRVDRLREYGITCSTARERSCLWLALAAYRLQEDRRSIH